MICGFGELHEPKWYSEPGMEKGCVAGGCDYRSLALVCRKAQLDLPARPTNLSAAGVGSWLSDAPADRQNITIWDETKMLRTAQT